MAGIGSSVKTLLDWGKEINLDGSIGLVAEVSSQKNDIIPDVMFQEGNSPNGELVEIRTGLPTSYFRLTNQGVPTSKATSAQVMETCAELTARSQVDRAIADRSKSPKEYRAKESRAFMESMAQKFATTWFYGSASNPEEIVGLANRYSSTSANNGQNIISAGGSGSDNTSIWLVDNSEDGVYGVFPMGSSAGLQHEDLGIQDAFDASNNRFRAYMDMFTWNFGLVVKDWRHAVRIPNIDVSDLKAQSTTQAASASTAIMKLMAQAPDRVPDPSAPGLRWYMNRTCASILRVAALEKSNAAVTVEESLNQFGKTIFQLKFLGIPVKIVDKLTNAESVVS